MAISSATLNNCLLLCILFLHQNYATYCVSSNHRNNINIYDWSEISSCNIPLNKPFIIKNSLIKHWSKSTINDIITSLNQYKISVVRQTSNCDCFNNQINLCNDYVRSFEYYHQDMSQILNMNHRRDSIWYKYESNYHINKQYMQCINRKTKLRTVKQTLNMLKRINSKSSSNMTSIQCPFGMKLRGEEVTYYNSIIKYDNLSPYFKIFPSLLNSFNDINMLNIWMGSTGYTTSIHFDKCDILYFMLNGNKTFLISNPDLYNKFTLYPFLSINPRNAVFNTGNGLTFEYKVDIYENEVFFLPA
eukprot:308011_1